MIVIDATVLADFLIGDEPLKEAARSLAEEDPEWVTTSLWRYELGNVLWKEGRFRKLDSKVLEKCLGAAESLVVETIEVLDAAMILNLACKKGLTFYDTSYVWLAISRGLTLRTRDDKVLHQFPDVAMPMPGANA